MKLRKTQVAAAVGAALFVTGTTVFAQAGPTVQVYGQISRALLFADDGTQSKWFHVDNESSGTRFGFTGTAPVNPGLRAGFRIELDLQSNESQLVSFNPAAGTNSPASNFPGTTAGTGFSERHMDAWFEGGWGRVNMGQGDGAANGASESDLSGTGMANGIGVADLGGGFNYRNTTAPAATPPAMGPTIGSTINQQDFESRYDRLLYVTPNFSGFRGQLSWGQSGNADVKEIGVFYGAKLGGLGELAAALGWSEQGAIVAGGTRDETMGGSVSWLHGSGLNLTYSFTTRDQPAAAGATVRDSTWNYFKVGFKRGMHAIGVDYAMGEDFAAVGDEATMYGIGYVFSPARWVDFTASYKIHSFDRSGFTYDDVTIASIGTRVRF
jgi:predicted porin